MIQLAKAGRFALSGGMRIALLALALAVGCSDGGQLDDGGDTSDFAVGPDFAGLDLYGVDLAQPPPADLAGPQPDLAIGPPRFTTAVTLYVQPTSGSTVITSAISGAQSSIDLELYLLTDSTITNALVNAQKAGRKVRVLLDPNPMGSSNASAFSTLQNGGVSVQNSNPAFTYTHEKGMIVDGKTLWAMTTNFTSSAFSSDRGFELVDTDPSDVAEAEAVFNADWARAAATATNLVVSPITSRSKLDTVISLATQEIDIEWEELSDQDIGSHLATKIKAGIPVKIIAPSNIAGSATATMLTALKATGAQVKLLSSPYVAAKLVLVDRAFGFIGSENATQNSIDSNRELGVLWKDATVASKAASTFDADFAKATPY
jgi:phosphatidylserine/phosphatidylglycerophosphate/cardiolipin synthase-like enzyme